jgi:hypothetical protein
MTGPVKPAIQGTHWLSQSLGMQFTIGKDVAEALERIVKTGTPAVDIETYGLGNDARKLKASHSPVPMRLRSWTRVTRSRPSTSNGA